MKILRIIKYLRSWKHYQPDNKWLENNKQALFNFISKNPIRYFPTPGALNEVTLAESKKEVFKNQLLVPAITLMLAALLLFGGAGLIPRISSPGSLAYSTKLLTEDLNCLLISGSIKKINCQIKQAENRLAEIQEMLELRGVGQNREALELTLRNYVKKMRTAKYSFVRLAAVEEDTMLILEAARQFERAKMHQEVISEVDTKTGTALEEAVKEAQIVAVDASLEADKQILRAEVSTSEDVSQISNLPSVKELNTEILSANSEILNLETVLLTLKSFHGYLALVEADRIISYARTGLDDVRLLVENERYIEAVDGLSNVLNLIIEAKEEIKKVEPNLNLNLQ